MVAAISGNSKSSTSGAFGTTISPLAPVVTQPGISPINGMRCRKACPGLVVRRQRYSILQGPLGDDRVTWIAFSAAILLRLGAIRYRLSLPAFKSPDTT